MFSLSSQDKCDLDSSYVDPFVSTQPPIRAFANPSLKQQYRKLQAQTNSRTLLLDAAVQSLSPQDGFCTNDSVRNLVTFEQSLGKGTYGSVCKVILKDTSKFPFSMALKRSTISSKDDKEDQEIKYLQALREGIVGNILTTLVRTNACPNFVMTYWMCWNSNTFVNIFNELADGNLAHWATYNHSEAEWLSVIFQVSAGLMWMARYYGLAQNDMYLRNIVYNNISPVTTAYRYVIQSRKYGEQIFAVDTFGCVPKITDFSLVSSNKLHGTLRTTNHDFVSNLRNPLTVKDPSQQNLQRLSTYRHEVYYLFLNGYGKDIATFLSVLYENSLVPKTIQTWACTALGEVYRRIKLFGVNDPHIPSKNLAFRTPEDLVDFIVEIFSSPFLANAGITSNPFSSRQDQDYVQTFILPFVSLQVPTELKPTTPNATLDDFHCKQWVRKSFS